MQANVDQMHAMLKQSTLPSLMDLAIVHKITLSVNNGPYRNFAKHKSFLSPQIVFWNVLLETPAWHVIINQAQTLAYMWAPHLMHLL